MSNNWTRLARVAGLGAQPRERSDGMSLWKRFLLSIVLLLVLGTPVAAAAPGHWDGAGRGAKAEVAMLADWLGQLLEKLGIVLVEPSPRAEKACPGASCANTRGYIDPDGLAFGPAASCSGDGACGESGGGIDPSGVPSSCPAGASCANSGGGIDSNG